MVIAVLGLIVVVCTFQCATNSAQKMRGGNFFGYKTKTKFMTYQAINYNLIGI